MSYSIQDAYSRLDQIERKLDFILKAIPVVKREESLLSPNGFRTRQLTLEQLYRELQQTDSSLVLEGEVLENGTDTDTDPSPVTE